MRILHSQDRQILEHRDAGDTQVVDVVAETHDRTFSEIERNQSYQPRVKMKEEF